MTAAMMAERAPPPKPTLMSKVVAEWTKLRSTRAFYIQLGLALLFAIGMSLLIAVAVGASWGDLTEADRADFDPLFVGAIGPAFAGIVLVITGVTIMSSEYTSGMIRLTMAASPKRLQVLFAKALVIALVMWAAGFVFVFGAFYAGQLMLSAYEGVPTLSLSDKDAQRSVLLTWLTMPVFPLIGMTLGAIMRSTASAITAVLAFIFVPGIFGGLLPRTLQENFLAYLPGNALGSLTEETESILYIEPAVAAIAVIGWLVAFFALSGALLLKRDV